MPQFFKHLVKLPLIYAFWIACFWLRDMDVSPREWWAAAAMTAWLALFQLPRRWPPLLRGALHAATGTGMYLALQLYFAPQDNLVKTLLTALIFAAVSTAVSVLENARHHSGG